MQIIPETFKYCIVCIYNKYHIVLEQGIIRSTGTFPYDSVQDAETAAVSMGFVKSNNPYSY